MGAARVSASGHACRGFGAARIPTYTFCSRHPPLNSSIRVLRERRGELRCPQWHHAQPLSPCQGALSLALHLLSHALSPKFGLPVNSPALRLALPATSSIIPITRFYSQAHLRGFNICKFDVIQLSGQSNRGLSRLDHARRGTADSPKMDLRDLLPAGAGAWLVRVRA